MFWLWSRVEQTGDEFKKIEQALKELDETDVLVGVPDAGSARDGGPLTNADLIYIHTHGAHSKSMRNNIQANLASGMDYSRAFDMYIQAHGSPIYAIPPRPIIEPAIENEKDYIAEMLRGALDKALDGNAPGMRAELEKTGMEAQNIVRDWFTNPANNWAPNAPYTIKQKGSENPLIDTGALRNSITYVIEPK